MAGENQTSGRTRYKYRKHRSAATVPRNPISSHGVGRKATSSATAYLVMDKYWYSVPETVRKATYWGFKKAFTVKKGRVWMRLAGVDHTRVPKQINFTDAVIRIYSDPKIGAASLLGNVNRQLAQVNSKLRRSTPRSDLTSLNPPNFKKLDIGASYTIKTRIVRLYWPSGILPICVTEGAIELESALNCWMMFAGIFKTHKVPNKGRLAWLESQTAELQKWFGVSLGRIIAHECYHQIWYGRGGAPHYGSQMLEADEAGKHWFKKGDHGFGPHGIQHITTHLPKLATIQKSVPTLPVKR